MQIKQTLKRRPFLVIDEAGVARLVDEAAVRRIAISGETPTLVVNALRKWEVFCKVTPSVDDFNAVGLGAVSVISHKRIERWVEQLDLRPGVTRGKGRGRERQWSRTLTYCFVIAASLRLANQPLPTIRSAIDAVLDRSRDATKAERLAEKVEA